ncbi:MAG: helix-turn-helix transcriptional regulator [Bacteroidota bacterium]
MNNLAKNIRYLRKQENWSQENLASKLGVKRSSIAAYESKNVEPRLKVILELGKLFNVDIADLIEKNIAEDINEIKPFDAEAPEIVKDQININLEDKAALQEFVSVTTTTRKMLDGLKVFYKFKLNQNGHTSNLYSSDINSFIMLVEHLLNNNEILVNSLTRYSDNSTNIS